MKKYFILSIFLSVAKNILGQYAPMSPQVSSAEGLFKTEIYSGAPSANIPIYNFNARDISVPISLIYTGGNGIRVNEEASWVGLGWHLQAGGFISQVVRGYDDFNTNGGYIYSSSKKLPCFEGQKNMPLAATDQVDCFGNSATMADADWGNYDLEPDVFILSLAGLSAKFFYDKNLNVFTSTSSSLTIIKNQSTPVTFTVQTEEGLNYNFNTIEQATDLAATDVRYSNQGNTWYLTSISSFTTGEAVFFNYNVYNANDPKLTQSIFSKTLYSITPNTSYIAEYNTASPGNLISVSGIISCAYSAGRAGTTYKTISPLDTCTIMASLYNKNVTRNITRNIVYLDYISTSSNLGKIYFNKSTRSDVGITNIKKLDEIQIVALDEKQVETTVLRCEFNYDYFNSDPTLSPTGSYYTYPYVGYEGKRLKLLSVQQKSGDGTQVQPSTIFSYIEGAGLPNLPYKTSFDIDHWGHYNYQSPAAHNTTLVAIGMIGVNRANVGVLASANLLQKIQNSSGSFTEFEYEASSVGVRVLRVSNYETTNNKSIKKYGYYSANSAYSMIPQYTYQTTATKYYTSIDCIDYSNGGVYHQTGIGGGGTPHGQSFTSCTFDVYSSTSTSPFAFSDISNISPTNYTMVTELNGENGELGKTEYYFPSITYNTPKFPFIPVNKNPLEGLITRTIVYKYNNSTSTFSKVTEEATNYNFAVVNFRTEDGSTSTAESFSDGGTFSYTSTTSGGLKIGLSYNRPNPDVIVAGYVMKYAQIATVTTVSTLYDQADPTKGVTTTNIQKFNQYGQIRESMSNNNPTSGFGKYSITYRYYERSAGAPSILKFKPVELISYDYTGDAQSGTIVKKSYLAGFNQYTSAGMLQSKWVSTASVTPSTSLIPTDASYNKELYNTYENINNNLVEQDATLVKNISNGYTNTFTKISTLWGYNNRLPIAVAKNADISQIGYNGFESGVISNTGGWDLGSSGYVSIIDKNDPNSDPTNIFSGRFSLKLNPTPNSTNSVFSPAYNLTPTSQGGKYKISCWIKSAGAIGQNKASVYLYTYLTSSPYTSFPSGGTNFNQCYMNYQLNDWQYIEAILDLDKQKLAAGTNSLSIRCFVANSDLISAVYIDDIRIQPIDAQMTTFTYKPGVGKTSEAGPDSKPVNYEYDSFGRLLYVKDFRKNILKKNQYFFK